MPPSIPLIFRWVCSSTFLCGLVERRHHHVLQHLDVARRFGIDLHAETVLLAVHPDRDHPAAGRGLDSDQPRSPAAASAASAAPASSWPACCRVVSSVLLLQISNLSDFAAGKLHGNCCTSGSAIARCSTLLRLRTLGAGGCERRRRGCTFHDLDTHCGRPNAVCSRLRAVSLSAKRSMPHTSFGRGEMQLSASVRDARHLDVVDGERAVHFLQRRDELERASLFRRSRRCRLQVEAGAAAAGCGVCRLWRIDAASRGAERLRPDARGGGGGAADGLGSAAAPRSATPAPARSAAACPHGPAAAVRSPDGSRGCSDFCRSLYISSVSCRYRVRSSSLNRAGDVRHPLLLAPPTRAISRVSAPAIFATSRLRK